MFSKEYVYMSLKLRYPCLFDVSFHNSSTKVGLECTRMHLKTHKSNDMLTNLLFLGKLTPQLQDAPIELVPIVIATATGAERFN